MAKWKLDGGGGMLEIVGNGLVFLQQETKSKRLARKERRHQTA
jgi:hypothetical protein